ncbi:MAG: exodeoxyribonuclease-3 [Myxococcota bacterium]|jgi:exodeoxyribonuclease-3
MRIVSWNVNGIRAAIKKGFVDSVQKMDADIVCLQEIKADEAKAKLSLPDHPYQYWNPADKAGYSGTAIFCRAEPLSVRFGLGDHIEDLEGRVVTVELEDFFLITVYTPNSGRGLPRLAYRTEEWDPAFLRYLQELEQIKPVVYCGDLNVAHQKIDIARPTSNRRSAGFTNEERENLSGVIAAGFVDTFRHFYPDATEKYSWWSYMGGARGRNVGWRLDYFMVSESLVSRVDSSEILSDVLGSDHCPVALVVS